MTISQSITDFTSAVEATRAKLDGVVAEITKLESERVSVANAQPHTDDIVAVLMRGLDSTSSDFERQLGDHLASTFTGGDGAAAKAVGLGRAFNILNIEARRPDGQTMEARRRNGETAPINVSVLTYFLRDLIAAEVPALVDRLCPSARNGMKALERKRALESLDVELERLRREREVLLADIAAARAAVNR